MSTQYLVLGLGGQLGNALQAQLASSALCLSIKDVDFCDDDFTHRIQQYARTIPLKAVINAAAYTQVDKAEGEGRVLSKRINADAVGELARWCAVRKIPLVHFSTDYVFSGKGDKPWREDDVTGPLNAYGADKLDGERQIRAACADHLIFRTSWLYDAHGTNFFNTMLRLMSERERLTVVADQIGAPTYVPQLAEQIIFGLEKGQAAPSFPSGTYHLCHDGQTSWHGFASAIFELASGLDSSQKYALKCKQVLPISTADYPTPATRPLNSRLDCSKAKLKLGISLGPWRNGLAQCFQVRFADEATPMPDSRSQGD